MRLTFFYLFLVAADPALVPTPPSGEPIIHVPGRRSPGLFDPLSPADSHCEFQLFAKRFIAHTVNPTLNADKPFIHLTPSPEEPTAVESFGPRLRSDADWNMEWPQTQMVRIPLSASQQADLPPDDWFVSVTIPSQAENEQHEMAIQQLLESAGKPGPSYLSEDKKRQIQNWASWIREF